MFDQIFGNFLVASELLTKQQFEEVIEKEKTVRVKMGLLAVAEKLMTKEQADEVNNLQAIMDKRFGDIAVEKGYLTEDQITYLLRKQGNIYLLFVQTIIDMAYLSLEEIEAALGEYQTEKGFSHSQMDDLVSGDLDRTIGLFLPTNNEYCKRLCAIAIRTIIRLIDSSAYIENAYLADELSFDSMAMQESKGDRMIQLSFAGNGNSLLALADVYAMEKFECVDLDALDAVGEFINCVNGLFAAQLSQESIDVDMDPPLYFENPSSITGSQFCVLPVVINGQTMNIVVSIDSNYCVN